MTGVGNYDALGWLATLGGLAAAYLGVALLLVALDSPARRLAARRSADDDGWPQGEPAEGYLDIPSDADDAVILQAGDGGTTAELLAMARAVARYGIGRVYLPESDAPLTDDGLAAFGRRLRDDGKPEPVALMTRDATGAVSVRFLGGRFGVHRVAPSLRRLIARDGESLAYRHIPASADTVLIVLHGAASHGESYVAWGHALSRLGVAQAYLLNLRGHDGSGRPGDVDRVGQHETDLVDLIEHVRSVTPGARIVVAGHSAGGGLALRLADGPHGRLADGYLLLAPYLGLAAPVNRRRAGEGWVALGSGRLLGLAMFDAVGLRGLSGLPVIGFHPPACVRDGRETLAYSYRMLRSLSPPLLYARGLRAAARRPLLVLIGELDEFFDPRRFASAVDRHAPGAVRVVRGATNIGIIYSAEAHRITAEWLTGLGRRQAVGGGSEPLEGPEPA